MSVAHDSEKLDKSGGLSIRQNMFWNAFGSMCNLGCQWLMTVVIVRLSDNYVDAGLFALAMSVYGIFLPIAQYRMYIYQISDTKGENTTGEYLAFRVITCLVSLVLCMVYAVITCSAEAWLTIFLFGMYKVANQLIDVLHASDQVASRMDYVGKSLALQGIGAFACFVLVFYFTKNLNLTLAVMAVAVFLVGVFYDIPRTRQLVKIQVRITRQKALLLARTCLPVVIGGIAFAAAPQLPRQFLFALQGDSALGVYASVAAPIAIIQMGASYIYYPFLTYLVEYYEKRDKKAFLGLIGKSTIAIAVLGVVCAVLLEWLAVPLLVLMYGESIAPYGYLVLPMLVAAILTGYTWFINDLLIALRNFRAVLVSSIVELVVALAVSLPLIRVFDLNGVTFVLMVSCVVALLVMGVELVRGAKKHFSKR